MKIILHADDFGFDKNTTEATIELLECNVLTSATIMANMPATTLATQYASQHPELSFGVHLTYVDGLKPCYKGASSLLDNNKLFLPSNDVRKRALILRLNKEDIVHESLAQIQTLRMRGVKVSHIDSHGHLHKFPSFLLALEDITKQSGINKVRRVQNVFLKTPKTSTTTILNGMFAAYIEKRFKTTKYFYMSANSMDTHWSDALLTQLDILPSSAVIEVGVHPGTIMTGKEAWRAEEYRDIKLFAKKIRESGKHQIITWNDL